MSNTAWRGSRLAPESQAPCTEGRAVQRENVGMKTAITDMFGIDVPILAFSHCRDVVAAVSKAGGMGVLGAVAHSPEPARDRPRLDRGRDRRPPLRRRPDRARQVRRLRRGRSHARRRPRPDPARAPRVRRRHPPPLRRARAARRRQGPRLRRRLVAIGGAVSRPSAPARSSRSPSPTAPRSSSTPSARRRRT